MSRIPGGLWHDLIAVQIFGANTGVGKTVISTLLGTHFAHRGGSIRWNIHYIKPVSTGPKDEADDRYLKRFVSARVSKLVQYDKPVSPHVAARGAPYIPNNSQLVRRLYDKLKEDAQRSSISKGELRVTFVETAGGVLSPGPSGSLQADIYRPMRLPVLLVGDHRLGGIATTISAAESLLIRGYDIDAVVCFDDQQGLENSQYLKSYLGAQRIPTFEIPWIPDIDPSCSPKEDWEHMKKYYETQAKEQILYKLSNRLITNHHRRVNAINEMASRTNKAIWHPFTQHKSISDPDDILVFDSAYGDYFQAKHTAKSLNNTEQKGASILHPTFDGSASWWTQGLGHGNPQLSLAAAYAAGRYGHIMFAGATNEPALTLAEQLLQGLKNPRLTKVFYSDDGSTAVEVGIKMALRAACKRYEWDGSSEELGVLGLKGSYHGDTIGAMDASEPCVYNKKVDWYRGRGYWFDYPTVKMRGGRWVVEAPAGMEAEFGPAQHFEELDDVFNTEDRGHSPKYEKYIVEVLDDLVKKQGRKFGALVMEPIILGAGGMIFVDPLFQRTLAKVIRSYAFSSTPSQDSSGPLGWSGVPIVHDEVFTGLYRLGHFSPSTSLLRVDPDISCHAKLLTGGLLPLSITTASDDIFSAFLGDEKSDALLHGHSYTAHPIGCHVANTALAEMKHMNNSSRTWKTYRSSWISSEIGAPQAQASETAAHHTWSVWSKPTVVALSQHPLVDNVIALGSVLAVSLKDNEGGGYTSNAAIGLRDALLNDISSGDLSVHSRVLGNVIYLMASMTIKVWDRDAVETKLLLQLDQISKNES